MKNFFLLLACMAVCGSFARAQQPLKLMTYNIRNANGLDNVRNYQRIANVIVNAAPDVVAIQETDSMTARSENRYVLGEIAERTQMKGFFASAIEYDGGKYGIGLLSRQTPLQIRTLPLPGREEKRTLLLAEFEDFVYCCVHLSLTEEDRMESLRVLTEVASGYDKPFFLAGDMNDEPGSRFTAELQKNFRLLSNPKHFTFPASAPDKTIDYIDANWKNKALAYRRIDDKDCYVIAERASQMMVINLIRDIRKNMTLNFTAKDLHELLRREKRNDKTGTIEIETLSLNTIENYLKPSSDKVVGRKY